MRDRRDWTADHRQRVDALIDEYRVVLHDALNELTEQEARRRLLPSNTTLLGLVKHATFVEGVWFDQAITGRSYADIGNRKHRRRFVHAAQERHDRDRSGCIPGSVVVGFDADARMVANCPGRTCGHDLCLCVGTCGSRTIRWAWSRQRW
jgi:hypothetical protein